MDLHAIPAMLRGVFAFPPCLGHAISSLLGLVLQDRNATARRHFAHWWWYSPSKISQAIELKWQCHDEPTSVPPSKSLWHPMDASLNQIDITK